MGITVILYSWLSLSLASFGTPNNADKVNNESKKVATAVTQNAGKSGIASFYHNKFVGRKTATGEVFSNKKYTAASNHYTLGSYVKVTNLDNGRIVYVKINDRMGHPSRSIDLTEVAARDLRFHSKGITKVKIETVSSDEGKRKVLAQSAGGSEISDNEL